MRNLSGQAWRVTVPSGEMKGVDNNGVMPIIPGLSIRFTKDETGEIIK